VAIYRIVQEGLTNAVKHAGGAAVHISVSDAKAVSVRVRDDGPGFSPEAHHEGFGLIGIRERVEAVGGSLRVDSAPGAGTTIEASLPVRRRRGEEPGRLEVAS
jgi:two-component system sensor histidine kinase UhpB